MTTELYSSLVDRERLSAGKIAVLGLDGIRARLGEKWNRLSGLVRTFFEAAIKRAIKPGDAFFEVGDLGYIVIFRDLSPDEAQKKCAALDREVCAKLFGEVEMEIVVRNLVAQIDGSSLRSRGDIQPDIDIQLEQRGVETIVSLDGSKSLAPAARAKSDLEISFSQQPHARFRCSVDQLSFVYRPIWDCKLDVVLTYLCQPLAPKSLGKGLSESVGMCTVTSGEEDCALLDQAVLSHCVRCISEMRQNNSRLLLGVPVHFTTISRAHAWARFGKTYRSIAPDVMRDIVFMVFGLEGVPNVRLVQEFPKLANARSVFCVVERDRATAVRGAGVGVLAVGFELQQIPSSDTAIVMHIKALASKAQQNGHESFVFGVDSTSRALNALAAGVRYLEGAAIHPPVVYPKHGHVLKIESLYRQRQVRG